MQHPPLVYDYFGHTFSARLGYYNPLRSYGEEVAIRDAQEASANGLIVIDLPPEEAAKFREICTSSGFALFTFFPSTTQLTHPSHPNRLSYVPLIAPSTSEARIADSFVYIISKVAIPFYHHPWTVN